MKLRQSLFTPGTLSLGVAIVASVFSGSPANAQTTTLSSTTSILPSTSTSVSTSSTTISTGTAALVPIAGTVIGASESVAFTGLAQVNAKVVTDPDFAGWPTAVISIDLSSLSGVGTSTGKLYVGSGAAIVNRPLSAVDTVQLTFPYFLKATSALSAQVGSATFNLSFNVNTMKLTGATGQIASSGL